MKRTAVTLSPAAQQQATLRTLRADAKSPTLRLWTVQEEYRWEQMQRDGVLRGDGRKADPDLRPGYNWLRGQMALRTTGYKGGFPIWAWYMPKPDLRAGGWIQGGTHAVRLELEIPRERVLLSDYMRWSYFVMIPSYLSNSHAEDEAFYRKIPLVSPEIHTTYPSWSAAAQRAAQKSWERIFDLESRRSLPWSGPLDLIQATVERVHLSEVRSVTPFVARTPWYAAAFKK